MADADPPPPRRAGALLAELRTSSAALVPGWAGVDAAGDFGAALYQVAARIGEQVTRRSDAMPDRDRLAFFEALELPGAAPRAATVPLTFVLDDKRDRRVDVPAGAQVGTRTGNIPFETRTAFQISPARIGTVVAADPANDRIEIAPAGVIAGKPRTAAAFSVRTLSPAEPGGAALQLSRTEGLGAGDMLRVGEHLYRVAKATKDSDLVTLADPVEASIPADAAVRRVDDLEAFTLRDLQQHRLYVGHKALFNLEQAAEIELRLDPPALAAKLIAIGIRAYLWGVRKPAKDPDWHLLDPAGVAGGTVTLRKDWEGAVEEVEIEGRKNRWLRIDLAGPIDPTDPPETEVRTLQIAARSATDETVGEPGVTLAYHNALPLATTTPFLPFGPEPQRFDTFSIAAPETLSKPGARAMIHVSLADATPIALAAADGRTNRVYGVGKDGQAYAFVFAPEDKAGDAPMPRWRAVGAPTERTADGQASAVRFGSKGPEGEVQLAAMAASTEKDLLLATDTQGRLWTGFVGSGDAAPSFGWTLLALPDAVGGVLRDPVLVAASGRRFLLGLGTAALFLCEFGDGHAPVVLGWTQIAADNAVPIAGDARLGASVSVAWPVRADMAVPAVALIDAFGELCVGRLALDTLTIAWRSTMRFAEPSVRPLLIEEADGHTVAAAEAGTGALVGVRVPAGSPQPIEDVAASGAIVPADAALRPVPADAAGATGVGYWGETDLTIWTPGWPARTIGLGEERATGGVLLPANKDSPPKQVIAGPNESILSRALPRVRREAGALYDAVAVEDVAAPLATGSLPATIRLGEATGIVTGSTERVGLPTGLLSIGDEIRLFRRAASGLSASIMAADGTIRLDPADDKTHDASAIEIGGKLYRIGTKTGDQVTLSHVPPGAVGDMLAYATGDAEVLEPFAAADQARLLFLERDAEEGETYLFADGAKPERQEIAAHAGRWAELGAEWTALPASAPRLLAIEPGLTGWRSSPYRRDYQSPELAWEYSDGTSWRRIEDISDGTAHLSRSGEIGFTVPPDLAATEVAGKKDLWVRARLVGGNYGRAKYEVLSEPVSGTDKTLQTVTVNTQDLAPPEIVAITARFALDDPADPQLVLAVNNLATLDQTQAAGAGQARFDMFVPIQRHVAAAAGQGGEDATGRAIYLCLTKASDVEILSLYVDAAEEEDRDATLVVDVLGAGSWQRLDGIDDETHGLLRSGLLRLPLSVAPAELPLFGRTGWWLRLRPGEESAPGWQPHVRGIYLNSVVAVQARRLEQEVLGSSDGSPGLAFELAEWPVVADSLDLRVRETLGDEEVEVLRAVDADAVLDKVPAIPGQWVRWRAVDSFAGQGADARVYRLDLATGTVLFADGLRGKIPPAGADSIRAFAYRAGGGSRGNVPAGEIAHPKTAIQSLDVVTNPVAASGGADVVADSSVRRESASASRRGPRPYIAPDARTQAAAVARIRDAGRIFTPTDIEAFVLASAPDIVAVRCLRGKGGFRVIVSVRDDASRHPLLSRTRRDGIAAALAERGSGVLTGANGAITVQGPRFVRVRIEAVLHVLTGDLATGVALAAQEALRRLIDPASGAGPGFGRCIEDVDIYRALTGITGLDRVDRVAIVPVDALPATLAPDMLLYGEREDAHVEIRIGAGA